MKILNPQAQTNTVAKKIHAVVALPVNTVSHFFMAIINLLINLPVMNTVWRERRELEWLIVEHSGDIGLTPDSIRQEMKRSYFDIPNSRKRSYQGAIKDYQSQQL